MKRFKKAIAIALACALTVGTAMTATAADPSSSQKPAAPKPVTASYVPVAGGVVATSASGTATLVKSTNKSSVSIGTVTVKGVKYTFNYIKANAFKATKKVKTVSINTGNRKVTIAKNAFAKSKVSKLKLRGFKKASNVSFKKGAFKSSKIKKVYVSKAMSKKEFNKIKKALRKAGFKGTVKRG